MARDRRNEILDVAGEIFLDQGFAAASMSAIAARLGGSKGTLYNYFPSKEELFRAHIERQCALSAENIFASETGEEDIAALFTDLGIRYLTRLSSDDTMRHLRTVIAEEGAMRTSARSSSMPAPGAAAPASPGSSNAPRPSDGSTRPILRARRTSSSPSASPAPTSAACSTSAKPDQGRIRKDVEAAVATFMAAYRA